MDEEMADFPVKTEEDITLIEEKLKNPNFFKKVVSIFYIQLIKINPHLPHRGPTDPRPIFLLFPKTTIFYKNY